MTLLEKAELFTEGAKRAADAGDMLAFIVLTVAAAQHIELAKTLAVTAPKPEYQS